jgi:hypothetical protein
MDSQINIRKRKRADTALDTTLILCAAKIKESIVVDHPAFRLPAYIEDDPNNSDADQHDDKDLEESTLFWSNQRVLSVREGDEVSLEKPTVEH